MQSYLGNWVVAFIIRIMESVTNKGLQCVIFQNNKFSLVYKGKHRWTWRCTVRKCKASVHTKAGETENIIEHDVSHGHKDSISDVQRHILRVKCKEQGKASLLAKPEAILTRELSKLEDTSTIIPKDILATKRAMYYAKRKDFIGITDVIPVLI